MKIRLLPSEIHARTFALLGAVPMRMDLTEAIAGIVDGSLDAQENPLANTVTYGVHTHHRFHTLSGHFYLSRGVYAHREGVDGWPSERKSDREGKRVYVRVDTGGRRKIKKQNRKSTLEFTQ